jgi:hypothetical protein
VPENLPSAWTGFLEADHRVVAAHPVPKGLSIHAGRLRAASCDLPSSTEARASMRREAAASRQRTASRRRSAALSSRRVTATVICTSQAEPRPRINGVGLRKAPAKQTRQEIGPLVLAVARGGACMLPVEWEDKQLDHFMVDLPCHAPTFKF